MKAIDAAIYRYNVLMASRDASKVPADASERFKADVERVRRHEAQEKASGTFRNLHIAAPRH